MNELEKKKKLFSAYHPEAPSHTKEMKQAYKHINNSNIQNYCVIRERYELLLPISDIFNTIS